MLITLNFFYFSKLRELVGAFDLMLAKAEHMFCVRNLVANFKKSLEAKAWLTWFECVLFLQPRDSLKENEENAT